MNCSQSVSAEDILWAAQEHAPTLGQGRLICIDGPAGSGKTTLAGQIAGLSGAPVVHVDEMLSGWRGLPDVDGAVVGLLRRLAVGETGDYRRFDWLAGEYRETHRVDPVPLLILEGVAAGNTTWAELITILVWIETAPDEQLRRGMARDGEAMREHWLTWLEDEKLVFARHRTRERADVVIST